VVVEDQERGDLLEHLVAKYGQYREQPPEQSSSSRSSRSCPGGATVPRLLAMAIARFPVVVLDCPEPKALAEFYGALLDWQVAQNDADHWSARAEYGDCLVFQKVEAFTPPQWPGQDVPQQMHIDVVVDDLDAAEAAVLELGATRHEHQPGTTYRVFLDPAGHPFCLCSD
jgi:predicted enzyme related to lactoylglutathione lyase